METNKCSLCQDEAVVHCPVDGYYFCREHVRFHDSIQMMHTHATLKNTAIDLIKKANEFQELGETLKQHG